MPATRAGTKEMVTMMWWNGGAGWAGWLLMSVGMVAFWALVIVAVIALIPGVRDERHRCLRQPERDDPPKTKTL